MKELSIFIDESGDFGEYDYRSPFYIISMVMHDQSIDISHNLRKLDNELSQTLSSVFHTLLDNVEFKKVLPSEYRLFQVADLVCTLKLTELKMQNHNLSKSEIYFFSDERTLKKNYIKPVMGKEL